MRRNSWFFFPLISILFCLSAFSHAQNWAGIIDPARATDWSSAGVVGDIPSGSWTNCTTAACNTLFGGSVTATTIGNALSSCPANNVVRIPAGTFSVGAFNDTKSNCALRGAGADQTKVTCTGGQSGGGLGGTNNPCIHLMSGATGTGRFGGVTTANWTAGYAQGTTVITLSATTGLVAGPVGTGSLIMLDQLDDPADGWPAVGDIYSCASASNNCSNQGGNNYARSGRAEIQVVTVTAINGSQVTISPGVAYNNIRTSQTPGAYWNTGSPLSNAGIEDMTIDFTPSGVQGIYIMNAANAWVKGVRLVSTSTGTQETYHIFVFQSGHVTVRSSYIYGRPTTGSPFPLANYAYSIQEVSDTLVENNIFQRNTESLVPNDPGGRNVYAYNFVVQGQVGANGTQMHSGNIMMDLYEGNNWETFLADVTHGTHHFETLFRNHFDGTTNNTHGTTGMAVGLLSNNRFFNAVANVIGSSDYSMYEDNIGANPNTDAAFNLGWQGNNSGNPVTNDTNVKRTLMRWGNWDQFTSTNDTGTNDQTGTRFVSAEVPSGITNFPNAVPASQTLPASFYLNSKPAWFGSVPFPAIGPDVASGNAPNTVSSPTGGHANLIPARVCYESAAIDSAYGSLNVRVFNADTCYGNLSPLPDPPTGLNATVK
jgi:hypothetical protein